MSFLLPRRPSTMQKPRKNAEPGKGRENQQQVWLLRDGNPVAIPVTVGVTNGVLTEIRSGEVQEGMALVVDTVSAKQ